MQPLPLQFGVPGGMEVVLLLLLAIVAAPFVLIWWLIGYVRDDGAE
jgi:hypothetical protein